MKPVHFLCSCFSGTLKKLLVFFLIECLSWWLYLLLICSDDLLWSMLKTSIILWYIDIWFKDIIFIFVRRSNMLTRSDILSPWMFVFSHKKKLFGMCDELTNFRIFLIEIFICLVENHATLAYLRLLIIFFRVFLKKKFSVNFYILISRNRYKIRRWFCLFLT